MNGAKSGGVQTLVPLQTKVVQRASRGGYGEWHEERRCRLGRGRRGRKGGTINVEDISMSHHELRGLAVERILVSQFNNASGRAQEEKRIEGKNNVT
jgi:hypothetical protein